MQDPILFGAIRLAIATIGQADELTNDRHSPTYASFRMSTAPTSRRLQSWIPHSFAWTTEPDVFLIDVTVSDIDDVIEFISKGIREVTVWELKIPNLYEELFHNRYLWCELQEAAWTPGRLNPPGSRIKAGAKVAAHCHGVFSMPDGKTLCVAVSRKKALTPGDWISEALKAEADALLVEYESKVTDFDSAYPQAANKSRPVLTADRVLRSLPRAVKFLQPTSRDPDKVARAALAAIAASGWSPSRDGTYVGILPGGAGRSRHGLVSWVPHTGLPSYPEVRWAVQKRLPAALLKPRSEQMGKPKFDTGSQPVGGSVQVQGFDSEPNDLKDALEDLTLDQSDFRNRVDDVRKDVKGQGFEAIAWFQPYHVWTEETWGIYVDARKLDDLALSLLDDFKAQQVHRSDSLAALLAFGLTYAHELFHARVEAALSWHEINAQQPRHLRYQERVYQALRETSDWLEEALANWWAWKWFRGPGIQTLVTGMASNSNADRLEGVVKALLNLAPPGYQDWRKGDELCTWRTFANQLSTGNPRITATRIGLPLESTLISRLPYDFQPADIPLRFVGSGDIADRLQSHPATFNVPALREIEKALKYFDYSLDASGGKGSHRKWTSPDQRAFTLPARDPVSTGVFKEFLHHVRIDKSTYVHKVRPALK